jgi:hypothetical protein
LYLMLENVKGRVGTRQKTKEIEGRSGSGRAHGDWTKEWKKKKKWNNKEMAINYAQGINAWAFCFCVLEWMGI